MMRAPFHGFAFWFDVEFIGPAVFPFNNGMPPSFVESSNSYITEGNHRKKRPNPNEALVLSTAPEDPPTHWQQTLIYFYDPLEVEQDQVYERKASAWYQVTYNPDWVTRSLELQMADGVSNIVMLSFAWIAADCLARIKIRHRGIQYADSTKPINSLGSYLVDKI